MAYWSITVIGRLGDGWQREDPVPDGAGQVAVFLDFENLVLGAGHGLAGQHEPIPSKALTLLCRGFGNASIRRAYADWRDERFGRYEQALATNGVDLVQIGRFTTGGHKNAADIRLTVDAMETLMTHPDVSVFILVTGDSDFAPLVATSSPGCATGFRSSDTPAPTSPSH